MLINAQRYVRNSVLAEKYTSQCIYFMSIFNLNKSPLSCEKKRTAETTSSSVQISILYSDI